MFLLLAGMSVSENKERRTAIRTETGGMEGGTNMLRGIPERATAYCIGACYAPLESPRRGGQFGYWHAYAHAIDMPSAMADVYSYGGKRGTAVRTETGGMEGGQRQGRGQDGTSMPRGITESVTVTAYIVMALYSYGLYSYGPT